jgi:hypothetical protein
LYRACLLGAAGDKKTGNDTDAQDDKENVFRYHDYTMVGLSSAE